MKVERPGDAGMVAALRLLVDPGESEAIVLAYEKGYASSSTIGKLAKWPSASGFLSLARWGY
jgi:predicted nucleic acid-binding protein